MTAGIEHWSGRSQLPRHRHADGYAALILAGGYEECGGQGRLKVGPGDVLLHDAFDAHLNRFQARGATVVNLAYAGHAAGLAHVADADAIARLAARDTAEASAQLCAQLRAGVPSVQDWPDALAAALLADPDCRLDRWAQAHGLAAETVSRGFARLFGITPSAFRLEVRARRAFALIARSDTPLAAIAAATGFADQAHMTRAVAKLTGAPPGSWRRSNPFKTAAAPSPMSGA